jgi:murein L,D-transpeptidase YafK
LLADGQIQLELLSSTYASVGQNGVGKNKEGDGKTLLGVHFTQRNLPGSTLPDLFGAGAIALNYPNAIDLWRNRTETGIWLYGTPRAQYTRAPLATDCCVVVATPKMERFLQLADSRMTPVIITEHMQWVDAQAPLSALQSSLQETLRNWLQARAKSVNDELTFRKH